MVYLFFIETYMRENLPERIILDINASAPLIEATDIFDREINLKDYRGKKVLVAFFRHAGCPFCNSRVHALEKKYKEWSDRGLEMIFFFESTKEILQSSRFHTSVSPIPLIADPNKVWYTKYGVENSVAKSIKGHLTGFFAAAFDAAKNKLPLHMMAGDESINTIPAEFLVNEQGIARKVHYARGLRDRISMQAIEEFIG